MKAYLQASEIIDWENPEILQLARQLAATHQTVEAIAQACFEWVRDEICHSVDYQMNPVTCRASEVLHHKTGYCYAKSHLLAALLRANHIPAGFCYQRLSLDETGSSYCLHGLNAVYLPPFGWYRIDARGNREGVDAQFMPPHEQLAFTLQRPGEVDIPEIFPEPLNIIVATLQSHSTWNEALQHLPDIPANVSS